MGEFLDTKVAQERVKLQESQYDSLETGVYVNHKLVEFETVQLFENKLAVTLPKGLTKMPAKMKKLKYPSEERPQEIYTNEEGIVDFAFSRYDMPIEPEETIEAIGQIRAMIQKVHPANIFYDLREEDIGAPGLETKLSWFDFKGYAVDMQTYNLIYVTPLAKGILHGVFNCPFKDAAEWKKAALLVVKSVRDLTLKRKDEIR